MMLPFQLDRIPQMMGLFLARRRNWDPRGEAVTLVFDESGDAKLFGLEVRGIIRECAPDSGGALANALIELDREIDYAGHYTHRGIKRVVTTPNLQGHGLARLMVTWAAVRVIDAEDLAHADWDRIVALGRIRLQQSSAARRR